MSKPTMDDVAREAGVSRALVSLVMRDSDKVSEHSRTAVLEAATQLGYRPNLSARHLASKRTRTFGMVINDLHNPYFAGVADGVKAAADATGYRLLLNSAFLNDDDERSALETFIDFNVDGIILSGARVSKAVIEQTAESVPVVVASDPVNSTKVDTINNDDHAGATLVVEHLVGLGHRHIVHIDGGDGAGAEERKAGYSAAMRRHGLSPNIVPGVFTEASGVDAAEMALKQDIPFTAIFAGNDMSALGALDALDAAGRRVPGRRQPRRIRQHVRRGAASYRPDHDRPGPRSDRPTCRRDADRAGRGWPHRRPSHHDRADTRGPRHDGGAAHVTPLRCERRIARRCRPDR